MFEIDIIEEGRSTYFFDEQEELNLSEKKQEESALEELLNEAVAFKGMDEEEGDSFLYGKASTVLDSLEYSSRAWHSRWMPAESGRDGRIKGVDDLRQKAIPSPLAQSPTLAR